MFTHASRLAKAIGLAAGLLLIGGSLVDGIALAADNGDNPTPAVTGSSVPTPVPTPGTTTGDRHGDDADDDRSGTPTATPSLGASHHDDDDSDDPGSDD